MCTLESFYVEYQLFLLIYIVLRNVTFMVGKYEKAACVTIETSKCANIFNSSIFSTNDFYLYILTTLGF